MLLLSLIFLSLMKVKAKVSDAISSNSQNIGMKPNDSTKKPFSSILEPFMLYQTLTSYIKADKLKLL
ncbi:hypothetical protein I634_02025 [Alteromonas mediterranea U8]|nr:hypothetical protein I634_02025 [Alteromonas mediterranea U8]